MLTPEIPWLAEGYVRQAEERYRPKSSPVIRRNSSKSALPTSTDEENSEKINPYLPQNSNLDQKNNLGIRRLKSAPLPVSRQRLNKHPATRPATAAGIDGRAAMRMRTVVEEWQVGMPGEQDGSVRCACDLLNVDLPDPEIHYVDCRHARCFDLQPNIRHVADAARVRSSLTYDGLRCRYFDGDDVQRPRTAPSRVSLSSKSTLRSFCPFVQSKVLHQKVRQRSANSPRMPMSKEERRQFDSLRSSGYTDEEAIAKLQQRGSRPCSRPESDDSSSFPSCRSTPYSYDGPREDEEMNMLNSVDGRWKEGGYDTRNETKRTKSRIYSPYKREDRTHIDSDEDLDTRGINTSDSIGLDTAGRRVSDIRRRTDHSRNSRSSKTRTTETEFDGGVSQIGGGEHGAGLRRDTQHTRTIQQEYIDYGSNDSSSIDSSVGEDMRKARSSIDNSVGEDSTRRTRRTGVIQKPKLKKNNLKVVKEGIQVGNEIVEEVDEDCNLETIPEKKSRTPVKLKEKNPKTIVRVQGQKRPDECSSPMVAVDNKESVHNFRKPTFSSSSDEDEEIKTRPRNRRCSFRNMTPDRRHSFMVTTGTRPKNRKTDRSQSIETFPLELKVGSRQKNAETDKDPTTGTMNNDPDANSASVPGQGRCSVTSYDPEAAQKRASTDYFRPSLWALLQSSFQMETAQRPVNLDFDGDSEDSDWLKLLQKSLSQPTAETIPIDDKKAIDIYLLRSKAYGRQALSQRSCRFELPMDIKLLEKMSAEDYLRKFCLISSRRLILYNRVYSKHMDKKGFILPKNLKKALDDILVDVVSDKDIVRVREMLNITDTSTCIDLELFGAIAALLERWLYPKFITQQTKSMKDNKKYDIEQADFYSLPWKTNGIGINLATKQLVESLS